jgi:hypothetical protein
MRIEVDGGGGGEKDSRRPSKQPYFQILVSATSAGIGMGRIDHTTREGSDYIYPPHSGLLSKPDGTERTNVKIGFRAPGFKFQGSEYLRTGGGHTKTIV